MKTIKIGIELNGTDGAVGEINPSTVEKVKGSFSDFRGCYYLLWINGNRTDTPLRSYRQLADAIAKACIEA